MSQDGYEREMDAEMDNRGCLLFAIFIVSWAILFWGEPDIVDGIIHFLMK